MCPLSAPPLAWSIAQCSYIGSWERKTIRRVDEGGGRERERESGRERERRKRERERPGS
jgi:hypothetical protein